MGGGDNRPLRSPPDAPLELVETCWRMLGPSRRELSCGIYRVASGLELRCGYGEHDLVLSQLVATMAFGRLLAADWKATVIAKGGFEDVAPSGDEGPA